MLNALPNQAEPSKQETTTAGKRIITITKSEAEPIKQETTKGDQGATTTTTTTGKRTLTTTTITHLSSSRIDGESKHQLATDSDGDDCDSDCDSDCVCVEDYTQCIKEKKKITKKRNVFKKKLQVALDESAKLKTKWISVTADAQKCKTKVDNLEIDLKKTVEINSQLTIKVNEYSTTINKLRSTVNELTIKNNKCVAESNEWKRKWEEENAKVITNEQKIKELEASNVDLTSRISKLNDDLSRCRNGNQQNDIEINKLKNTVTDLKKQVSTCTVDLGSCNVTLKRVTDQFDADQLLDVEKEKRSAKLELELSECNTRKKDIEKNLESEKKNVGTCKDEIVTIRAECSRRYQKYEDDITELKSNTKVSIDRCEDSLKTERDENANIRNNITKLQNRITDLETKLTAAISVSDDWQKKSKFCEDDSIVTKQTIETLRTNLADTNKHVSTCVANSNSLQSELNSCKSNLEICSGDLGDTKKRLTESEVNIVDLNKNIVSLESIKKSCQTEISTLRCDVNQYFENVKSAEEKAYEAATQVLSILDGNKKSLSKFVGSHDLTCRA